MGESIKSRFKPSNPKKYMGDSNNIICRSSWERVFCNWCDKREDVVKWASEEFSIPYVSPKDNRVHRYYPDYLIEVKETGGKTKKYIVEVKPKKQTLPPKKPQRQTKSFIMETVTYAVNQAKWAAATDFALDNGCEFKIITEDELGIKQHARREPRSRQGRNSRRTRK